MGTLPTVTVILCLQVCTVGLGLYGLLRDDVMLSELARGRAMIMAGTSLLVATLAGVVAMIILSKRLTPYVRRKQGGRPRLRTADMVSLVLVMVGAGVFSYVGENARRTISVALAFLVGIHIYVRVSNISKSAGGYLGAWCILAGIAGAIAFVPSLSFASSVLFYIVAPVPMVVAIHVLLREADESPPDRSRTME